MARHKKKRLGYDPKGCVKAAENMLILPALLSQNRFRASSIRSGVAGRNVSGRETEKSRVGVHSIPQVASYLSRVLRRRHAGQSWARIRRLSERFLPSPNLFRDPEEIPIKILRWRGGKGWGRSPAFSLNFAPPRTRGGRCSGSSGCGISRLEENARYSVNHHPSIHSMMLFV